MNFKEMKELNESIGDIWFSKDALAFWNTEIMTDSNELGLFITSDDDYDRTKKLYSVRRIAKTGHVETLSFQCAGTLSEAKRWIKNFTRALMAEKCSREDGILKNVVSIQKNNSYGDREVYKISSDDDYFLFEVIRWEGVVIG